MFVKLGYYNQSDETFDLKQLEYPPLDPEMFAVYFKSDEDVTDYYDDRFFYVMGIFDGNAVAIASFNPEQLGLLEDHLAKELE